MAKRTLFTIGHSTRTWREFIALLNAWKIEELVDVRTVPKSRAFPRFSKSRMKTALAKAGVKYIHVPELGGLRHSKKDSINTAWRNASFRGYADYMQTDAFASGLKKLNKHRKASRVCIMCSEAVWWRCHRRMIADAEVASSVPVKHIMSLTKAAAHEMTAFAKVKKKRNRPPIITYPARKPSIKSGAIIKNMMSDLTSPRVIYFKAILFVLTGVLACTIILIDYPTLKVAGLMALAIWAFARAYYFAFYVIQHYVDPGFRYAGLTSFIKYLLTRRGSENPPPS